MAEDSSVLRGSESSGRLYYRFVARAPLDLALATCPPLSSRFRFGLRDIVIKVKLFDTNRESCNC